MEMEARSRYDDLIDGYSCAWPDELRRNLTEAPAWISTGKAEAS
jgi:hypothetical protein